MLTHQISSSSSVLTKATPLRNSIRSRDGREIGRVLTTANDRELGRVYTAEERARAQQAANLLLSPNNGGMRGSTKSFITECRRLKIDVL